ncbi:MAG: ATP-dependent Clp protease proteolytic subunit [Muribaculaceae bacterium]|nr:ATP-dependent Clp protease proteolytic subunit [Muribaculaceae bacterium]
MDYQLIIDDYIGDWWLGTDKQSIRHKLAMFKGKHVDAKISSLGGSLDDGLDIRQQFIDHGDVTAYLHGFVASAATVIAMGAKKIVMGKYALFLVHQCSNAVFEYGQMNATDLQALIDRLQKNKEDNEKIDKVLAAMYASRCKNHSQEELLDLLKESKWLTAQEALDWGFVDEILDADDDAPELTNALAKKFNAAGLPLTGLEIQPERGGLLNSILDSLKAIKDIITPKEKLAACDDTSTNQKIMDKEFKTVASVLKVDTLASKDGKVILTTDQLQAIEDRLNDLESQHSDDVNTIAECDNTINTLEQQVMNLQAAPADETGKVDEASADNNPMTSTEMYNFIKDLI